MINMHECEHAKDGPFWRSPERLYDAVVLLVKEGFISEDQATAALKCLGKFAKGEGFIEAYGVTFSKNAFTSRYQKAAVMEYIEYLKTDRRDGQTRRMKLEALGITPQQISDWTEKYVGPRTLQKILCDNSYRALIFETVRQNPWITTADIQRITGIRKPTVHAYVQKLKRTGKMVSKPLRGPRQAHVYAVTSMENVPCQP